MELEELHQVWHCMFTHFIQGRQTQQITHAGMNVSKHNYHTTRYQGVIDAKVESKKKSRAYVAVIFPAVKFAL